MFDVSRILDIPDNVPDFVQMGISGGARAELKDRGFIRKDGIKAKDYMIRTIKKTAKNKEKAEKAVIKGDKKVDTFYEDKRKDLTNEIRKLEELHSLDKKADALLRKTKGQPKEERIKKLIDLGIDKREAENAFLPSRLSFSTGEPAFGFVQTSKPTKIRKLKAELELIKDK